MVFFFLLFFFFQLFFGWCVIRGGGINSELNNQIPGTVFFGWGGGGVVVGTGGRTRRVAIKLNSQATLPFISNSQATLNLLMLQCSGTSRTTSGAAVAAKTG